MPLAQALILSSEFKAPSIWGFLLAIFFVVQVSALRKCL
jgi:hypothetical protein